MRDKLQEIGEAFLRAPFGRLSLWDTPLRQLAELTGSSQAQLIGMQSTRDGAESLLFNYVTDQHPQAAGDYFALAAEKPRPNWKAEMRSPPLSIVADAQYEEVAARAGPRDMFTQYLKDYRGFNGARTTLIDDQDAQFTLALLREDVTTSEQLEMFRAVVPYAHAAVLMQRAMESQGLRSQRRRSRRSISQFC